MDGGGLLLINPLPFPSPSHRKFQLDNNRVGSLRLVSELKRVNLNSSSLAVAASVGDSGAHYSEQLLGAKPQKKEKRIAGIEQDELVDPSALADPDSCFCEFNGVKVHHKVFDAESPPQNLILDQGSSQITKNSCPMILLHGFGASLFSWHRIMKHLAQIVGSKVLAFDRPAFGLTSRVNLNEYLQDKSKDIKPLNPYSLMFSVLATLHFIDFLAAEKAVLVGHSAGSLVAVNAYFEAPKRVAALILVAPAIIAPLFERKIVKQKNSGTDSQMHVDSSKSDINNNPFRGIYSILSKFSKFVVQAIVNLVTGMGNMINSLYKKALSALLRSALAVMLIRMVIDKFGTSAVKNAWYDQNQVTEHILYGYTKPLKAKGWDKALAEYTAAMLADSSSESKPSMAKRLHEISCPVLIITGDNDRLVPSWNSVRLARAIPGSSLEIIKNCGHLPHEEKPEEFVLIVEKFLQRVLCGSQSQDQFIQATT